MRPVPWRPAAHEPDFAAYGAGRQWKTLLTAASSEQPWLGTRGFEGSLKGILQTKQARDRCSPQRLFALFQSVVKPLSLDKGDMLQRFQRIGRRGSWVRKCSLAAR